MLDMVDASSMLCRLEMEGKICANAKKEGNRRSFPSITYDVLDIVDSLIKILQMVLAECSVQGQCCSTVLDFDGWFKEIETGQSIFFFFAI